MHYNKLTVKHGKYRSDVFGTGIHISFKYKKSGNDYIFAPVKKIFKGFSVKTQGTKEVICVAFGKKSSQTPNNLNMAVYYKHLGMSLKVK